MKANNAVTKVVIFVEQRLTVKWAGWNIYAILFAGRNKESFNFFQKTGPPVPFTRKRHFPDSHLARSPNFLPCRSLLSRSSAAMSR